ncbi:hypothetical protein EYF80_017509 [Liparis tanakae]|uniref:Uncharacterized protein n=1 Tax=Liparis tanakae TaxID=230148 RepID=A0A4Z2I440_9TELE|nr:hypothetical protein EYF80_017509 [Liparis tanakae]
MGPPEGKEHRKGEEPDQQCSGLGQMLGWIRAMRWDQAEANRQLLEGRPLLVHLSCSPPVKCRLIREALVEPGLCEAVGTVSALLLTGQLASGPSEPFLSEITLASMNPYCAECEGHAVSSSNGMILLFGSKPTLPKWHLDIRASSDDTPVMIPGSWSSRKKERWKGWEIARENGLMETKSEKMRNSTWMRKSNVGDMSDRGEADMRNG